MQVSLALDIAPTLRPEDVSVEDYVRIANYLTK
jgi:16S rRNA (adenine1518-N6/adenine1519-N6)-dimethyltransferase